MVKFIIVKILHQEKITFTVYVRIMLLSNIKFLIFSISSMNKKITVRVNCQIQNGKSSGRGEFTP